MRNVLAAIAGIVAAFITIYLVELVGHMVYPPPSDLNWADSEQMATYVATLPVPALLFPMFAWFIGTIDGTIVASLIGRASPKIFAGIVGGLVLVGTVVNLIMIPHPMWFMIAAIFGILASGFIGAKIGESLQKQPAGQIAD